MCTSMIFNTFPNFQHRSKLLEQGREIVEIGAQVFEILGLVEKIVNREGPARVMTLLGFAFNSSTHILSIPEPKQVELLHLISHILDIKKKRWVSAVERAVIIDKKIDVGSYRIINGQGIFEWLEKCPHSSSRTRKMTSLNSPKSMPLFPSISGQSQSSA